MSGKIRKLCHDCGEEKGNTTGFCHKCFRYTENLYIEEPVEDMSHFKTPKLDYPIRMVESYTPSHPRERKTRFVSWPDTTQESFHKKNIDIEKVEQEIARINAEIAKIDPELRKSIDEEIEREQERERKINREMNTKYSKHRDIFGRNMDSIIENVIVSIHSIYPAVEFDYFGVSKTTMQYTFKFTFFITFPKHQLNAEEFEAFISKKGYYVLDQIYGFIPEKVMNPKVDGLSDIKSRRNYTQYTITFECPATAYSHLVKE